MEAENPALKDCQTLAASHDLTCKTDQTPKQAPVKVKKIVAFFIGGAGDKEKYYQDEQPHGNVVFAEDQLVARFTDTPQESKFRSVYLSYKDVHGEKDIQKYVFRNLGDKSAHVCIVGHSLGGWNGAHLSSLLKDNGYTVASLVTLDPVGQGALVWLGSDIYFTKPTPAADYWINILAAPQVKEDSDKVADFGEKWTVTSGPNINASVDLPHRSAGRMFKSKIQGEQSACDLVYDRMIKYLES